MTRVSELIRARERQVRSIDDTATIRDAATTFLENEISSLLVMDGDRVVGIVTKNDLVRSLLTQGAPEQRCVSEVMSTHLFTVGPEADLEDVFGEMIRRGLRHVPVMENGRPAGMITPIDILLHQKSHVHFENRELMRYIHGTY